MCTHSAWNWIIVQVEKAMHAYKVGIQAGVEIHGRSAWNSWQLGVPLLWWFILLVTRHTTVCIWDNDSLLVYIGTLLLHLSKLDRSLAPHWRSNVEAEWDGTSITRGGESRAGDDFSSAERCAKSRWRRSSWRLTRRWAPLWASIDRYVSFVASGHVIYTFLGEAFWLSDPILCLFVVGIMQTKISSVIIRFILFLCWIGSCLCLVIFRALAGLKTFVSI